MSKTIFEKIWERHIIPEAEGPGLPSVLGIDFMLLHEVTSIQAFDALEARSIPLYDRTRIMATLDHSIPTRKNRFEILDAAAKRQVERLRELCREHNIPLCDFGSGKQGIVHVIGPELGLTHPGLTLVCGDSHTATHGAFGALAFGIGTSEVAHVLATGCILQKKPKTMRVNFKGKLPSGVCSKDAVLKLIATIGVGGGAGYIIEYCGEAIRSMTMEERMTTCNMSIECGARAGLISPDDTTIAYLKSRPFAPKDADWDRAEKLWRSLATDSAATFDAEVDIELSDLKPMVTWGTLPDQAVTIDGCIPELNSIPELARHAALQALSYTKLEPGKPIAGTPIDWAFIGSCTNGRIEDLRLAAQVLKGKRVHPDVTLYVVPGSEAVMAQAEKEGLKAIFEQAGADFRMPGCSMCLAMNDDKVPAGKRCISTSNRNFIGRQGPGSLTHLASPLTVAASAIKGSIASVETV